MSRAWVKYPRTLHMPGSPGVASDDKQAASLAAFKDTDVVVTEKMDGENTSLYADGYHARSLDSGFHPSRARLAALHGEIAHLIRTGWCICGENLFARHAVAYDALPSHFLVFSIWDDQNTCLSWQDTERECARLGLHRVPTLFEGRFAPDLPERIAASLDTDRCEGFVLRRANGFPFTAFQTSVAKWVRAGHVQSADHWRKGPLVPNTLCPPEAQEP